MLEDKGMNQHTGLDDTGLDSADRDCADTTDLVDVLERETEGLVGGSGRGLDGVDGLEEGLTLGNTRLGLLGPSLVPGHATREVRKRSYYIRGQVTHFLVSSNMLSPCQPEIGTKGTALGL